MMQEVGIDLSEAKPHKLTRTWQRVQPCSSPWGVEASVLMSLAFGEMTGHCETRKVCR